MPPFRGNPSNVGVGTAPRGLYHTSRGCQGIGRSLGSHRIYLDLKYLIYDLLPHIHQLLKHIDFEGVGSHAYGGMETMEGVVELNPHHRLPHNL